MDRSAPLPVVVLPGGVTPVALSYAPLLEELGGEIAPLLKDLEVYAADEPPADYSLQLEVDALERFVDAQSLDTFHLVGFSGGGAVSVDFAAQHPERLRSLAIYEPARQPGPLIVADHPEYAAAHGQLDPDEMMAAFTRLRLRPGVEPPPPPSGPAPDWMAKRPPGHDGCGPRLAMAGMRYRRSQPEDPVGPSSGRRARPRTAARYHGRQTPRSWVSG